MQDSRNVRLALLIDSENISARYLETILKELPKHGVATYRRIYGDFTDPKSASWRELLLDNAIMPIQQFSNVGVRKTGERAGKNATDSALIIDAMDILYEGKVDGFVIVSSDSDFTRLAQRLRESAMAVIGMGMNHTATSFRHACTTFVNIEYLSSLSSGEAREAEPESDGETTLAEVEDAVAGIVRYNDSRGEQTLLSSVGVGLRNRFPEFDVRTYGYTKLSKMIDDMRRLEVKSVGGVHVVALADTTDLVGKVGNFMRHHVASAPGGQLQLSQLAQDVYEAFPRFQLKDTGYAQFWRFADSVKGVQVAGQKRQLARIDKDYGKK